MINAAASSKVIDFDAKAVGPAGSVWAFEPASDTAALLAEGIDANKFYPGRSRQKRIVDQVRYRICRLLNLFCCKRQRAEELSADGLLMEPCSVIFRNLVLFRRLRQRSP